ncbi:MAG: S8 family serine peptidase, partial [Pseudomonadota bacterium]
MKQLSSFIFVILMLLFGAGPMPASSQSTDFQLVDANRISSSNYLILTVPLDDAEALQTVARDIESRFDVTLTAEWPLLSIAVHCFVVDASRHSEIEQLITRMRADQRIRTVQSMEEFETKSEVYQDPFLPIQTGLHKLNAVRAHFKSTGAGITVAVIDSGIDQEHPDLSGRLIDRRDFVSARGDGAAEAHGTAIAGVIGADASNAQGMVGVAPEAKLMALRACWQDGGPSGHCSSFSLARALNFAILNEADVINLSLGGPHDPLVKELIGAALLKGAVVVAAWGTEEQPAFPASVPGVIAAGSPIGRAIPAPSIDVISTAP